VPANPVKILILYDSLTGNVSRDMTLHNGAVAAKAPTDEQCQAACRLLGRRLGEWTATYVHGIKTAHPGLKLPQRRPPLA
jgi:hypothetical protein